MLEQQPSEEVVFQQQGKVTIGVEGNLINQDDDDVDGDLKMHFNISAKELSHIVEKYKERGDDMLDLKYFRDEQSVEYLLETLKTDVDNGISSTDFREKQFGTNKIFMKPPPSFCDFVLEAISDKMIIILIIASIVEIGISMFNIFYNKETSNLDYIDGAAIIVAVIIVVLVGSITNYKKEMKFQNLNRFQSENTKYSVKRGGSLQEVTSDDILVGDLIQIQYGDILPADMLLVESQGMKIDESSLTGESDACKKKVFEDCESEYQKGSKHPPSNILLSGTDVIEGSGKAIVLAVGKYSQKGKIRLTIENAQEDNQTPLEKKLNDIADLISWFGLGSAIVTLVALSIQLLVIGLSTKDTNPMSWTQIANRILKIIILCISIIAVAIPEGLPLAVSLSLAFSIKKLMDQNNLVRKMHSCETMGGANYICTDKTGTLTRNQMQICTVVTNKKKIELKVNRDAEDVGKLKKKGDASVQQQIREDYGKTFRDEKYWEALKTSIALNVDARITKLQVPDINGDRERAEANSKTDQGFIDLLYRFKSPISKEQDAYMRRPEDFKMFPFDSKKKRMTTFVKSDKFPTGYRMFTKGGAENATVFSTHYIDRDSGQVKELTPDEKEFINDQVDAMNRKCMRSLYTCYRDITEEQYNDPEGLENGLMLDQQSLVFICVVGMRDSLRDRVKESVVKCHEASVKVIMVTGDNIVTATAIAKECNILGREVDVDNLRDIDIEKNPSEMNDPNKRHEHVRNLLLTAPHAITGNSFFSCIEGIVCDTCKQDSEDCRCPKTDAEAAEICKKTGEEKKEIKKDMVKNMENFRILVKNLNVMARSQPLHKYALVLGLREMGNVVAVTGDGTNDAPALSKSDVGFAMNDGTDIAKEASDIVIMDNNFSSIVVAIIYGRSIYENIRKFLQFQLTVNFCACILVFICSCIGNETPLTSVQMLWVNLIMDSLGSLALATEPPYEELLKKEPTKKNESIINGTMWKHIILQSVFLLVILIILYLKAPTFLVEGKEDILQSHTDLYNCFLHLPNNVNYKTSREYILYGTENSWSNDIKIQQMRKETYEKYNCSTFLPDAEEKWFETTMSDAYSRYTAKYGATTHLTFIFNTFVFYTLFNQVNCRVIDDSFNIFKRISKGCMFVLVTLLEMGIQAFIVSVGNTAFKCVAGGLDGTQWGICLAFGVSAWVVSFIIKLIPLGEAIDRLISKDKEEKKDEEEKVVRKSRVDDSREEDARPFNEINNEEIIIKNEN